VTDSQLAANATEETGSTVERGSAVAAYPGTPRWVKLGLIGAVVVIVLVVLVMVLAAGSTVRCATYRQRAARRYVAHWRF
jgi:hypothetical protein